MELRIKRGRGYVSADKNFDEDLGIGWIPIDSVHSPVKKVNYLVEAARLGQTTDYDKLTLDVWTNGSVTPATTRYRSRRSWCAITSTSSSTSRRATSRQSSIDREPARTASATSISTRASRSSSSRCARTTA